MEPKTSVWNIDCKVSETRMLKLTLISYLTQEEDHLSEKPIILRQLQKNGIQEAQDRENIGIERVWYIIGCIIFKGYPQKKIKDLGNCTYYLINKYAKKYVSNMYYCLTIEDDTRGVKHPTSFTQRKFG